MLASVCCALLMSASPSIQFYAADKTSISDGSETWVRKITITNKGWLPIWYKGTDCEVAWYDGANCGLAFSMYFDKSGEVSALETFGSTGETWSTLWPGDSLGFEIPLYDDCTTGTLEMETKDWLGRSFHISTPEFPLGCGGWQHRGTSKMHTEHSFGRARSGEISVRAR